MKWLKLLAKIEILIKMLTFITFFTRVESFSFIGVILSIHSCVTVRPLSFERVKNDSNSLKLDGYYYTNGSGLDSSLIISLFLYKNGIVKETGAIKSKSLLEVDKKIIDNYIIRNSNKNSNLGLGVYKIESNRITIEYWKGAMDWYNGTINLRGEILNDSTLVIRESKFSRDRKTKAVNRVYYFHSFHPKPDSTNKFIK